MNKQVHPASNEHVFEIRYLPNPKILDYRGTWAEQISLKMGLKQWQIIENRVDVFSDNQIEHAFVGFRNAGFTASDTPTKNFFPDKAMKLFRILFELDGFGESLFVERIGVRSRFCTPFDDTFEKLVERFATMYVVLSPEAKEKIGSGAQLLDIGAPLNFADKLGNFNTLCGPMTDEQLTKYFRKDVGFPPVGLYYDIDYFLHPKKIIAGKEILSMMSSFAKEAWDRHERISHYILGA